MNHGDFVDTFTQWLAERGPSLAVPVRIVDADDTMVRLEFPGIPIFEVDVGAHGSIEVLLVTAEGIHVATVRAFRAAPGVASPRALCDEFEIWIAGELAQAVAVGLSPAGAAPEAVLLRDGDDDRGYPLTVALRRA